MRNKGRERSLFQPIYNLQFNEVDKQTKKKILFKCYTKIEQNKGYSTRKAARGVREISWNERIKIGAGSKRREASPQHPHPALARITSPARWQESGLVLAEPTLFSLNKLSPHLQSGVLHPVRAHAAAWERPAGSGRSRHEDSELRSLVLRIDAEEN